MEFTEAILQEIAATYDPALSEAPLVIGHPKLNAPAYGWAKGLEVRDGMLYAEPHQVVPEFAEAANRKMYKKRSASVYLPDSPGNPVPGKHYLRHIGFLGAVPPAIKGIPDAPLNFAEDDGALAIEFAEAPYAVTGLTDILRRLRDFFVEREGAERADQLIPQWQLTSIEEDARRAITHGASAQASFSEPAIEGVDAAAAPAAAAEEPQGTVTPSDGASESAARADRTSHPSQQDTTMPDEAALDERQRQLDEREQQLATREAELAQRQAQKHRNEIAEFAEGLVKSGQLLPRQKAPVIELLVSLPADEPLEFAEGDGQVTKPAAEVLRGLLAELPKQIEFSEKSGDGGDLSFGSAHAIAARAQTYQEEQRQAGRHISTTEAVSHITKGAQ
ncbi:peptidase [Pseudomonas aeruginosa]|uniref:peptidase n=1 Tax=Pseudomonas aeruginosa TaxID=287 RepID=UPI0009A328ED|nr:peptidase [Pseudomonas aeruginosa]EJA3268115.1 peptidase [Pseudomonas aeruginosa]EKU0578136.1 peptidase [Pseudomonas aeruginosa]ELM5227935.1 peptidase [Pseudomonas aeruginosa]ELP1422276.1 peptidase [Pseudomonas aeruginosa]ELQ7930167.1 peptidase [Pseudomonas aeruginosa]